ncbi:MULTISPECIES: DUF418 domain-containing protein [unclassified Gordonia (in: high G+C Gram-positive bacteria)]|uniref:DUF418 domain-containing protein n=1 Tax=unclassified Gordonia (in: high G+C Gram-positive bacteria) TaxID=2657482 RepID=UPI001F0DF487|nr:DUF418 domain-containing protein [Gordonia sp. ABSL49_1]MCH5644602.1 DUF418 domain-containing protein [Gordonia sp. ABSL49_1]
MADQRFVSLDVLRGIAILGTLGTNIWIFTNVDGFVGYLSDPTQADGAWRVAQVLLEQLTQGKFLGLLTIMFGIGLAIQQASATRRGRSWPGRYYWRAILLFIDGTLNYLLFTEFDVLMGYAVTGLIVAYLLSMGIRRQRVAIGVAATVHLMLVGLIVWALAAAPGSAGDRSEPLSPNPYADGSFVDLVVFRIQNIAVFRAEVVLILPMSIALFLIGAALLRAGVLEPRGAMLRRRLMIAGLGVAAPLDFVAGIFGGTAGLILGRYVLAPVVSLAILAWVAGFYADGRAAGRVGRLMSPVGRTALSCYVLQNAIAGAICYGWGLGLAAHLDATTVVPVTIALYLAISATMIVLATLWLRRFNRGPLEWLWHSSYQRLAGEGRPRTAANRDTTLTR